MTLAVADRYKGHRLTGAWNWQTSPAVPYAGVEIPIGTAFGIYALVVLLKTEAAFAQSSRA